MHGEEVIKNAGDYSFRRESLLYRSHSAHGSAMEIKRVKCACTITGATAVVSNQQPPG
jgi:hypothetical protein